MKFVSKTILLLFVLVMASACSAAFEESGLSADDASMLSAALSTNPATESLDFNYTVDVTVVAEGDNINVTTSGRGISDPATGSSSLSMAGEVSGIPDFGGETVPYDIELRTIDGNDLYVRGIATMMDPSMSADQWIYLDVSETTDMAMGGSTELGGVMADGEVDFAGMYDVFNSDFLGSATNYIQAERVEDMDGMAHFTVNLELSEWLSSDELQSGLEALIPAMVGDAMPPEELEANMSQLAMLPMVGMLFSDSTFQFDYFVDPSSGTLSQATMTVAILIDPAMMGQEGEPVTIDLNLDVMFNEFGADSTIVAPEDFIDPMGG